MARTLALGDPRLVTTWTRLRRAGHTTGEIGAQLAAGRWQRRGHAIVLHNGPLTQAQRWFVARMHTGSRSALTAFTAVQALGLTGWERTEVHVLVPRGARLLTCPVPIELHRVHDWTAVRLHPNRTIHDCSAAVLVAAGSFPTARPACGIVAAAVQQRLVGVQDLSAALTLAPRVRHRRLLIAALNDIAQGAEALSEIDFVRLCRRHGLPAPIQQAVRRERSGRRRYLDASWRRGDGRLIVAEVDGALHLSQKWWWADQHRQNELMLADALVLRYPSVVVRTEPTLVADQLRRALGLPPGFVMQ